jgi:glucan biosynthesis protein C
MKNRPAPASRNPAFDAARAFLLLLGIILHTASIYSQIGHWLIADKAQSHYFGYLIEVIHTFRMPAFFLISGYFCGRSLSVQPPRRVARDRLLRLLLPLLTSWLLLNTLQLAFLNIQNGHSWYDGIAADGIPIYHLWFLVDLLLLNLLLIGIYSYTAGKVGRWLAPQDFSCAGVFIGLSLLSYAMLAAVRLLPHSYDLLFGLTSPYRLIGYAPYFLAGAFFYSNSDLMKRFLQMPVWSALLAIPFAIAVHNSFGLRLRWQVEPLLLLEILALWIAVASCLKAFVMFFSRPTAVTNALSEASYTIFLFHHLFVVLFGTLLLNIEIAAAAKFVLVVTFTLLVCTALHFKLIKRSRLLRFLFNGK